MTPQPAAPRPDWRVSGYTEVRELGSGASGTVVLAHHDATGAAVAVKYLADALCRDPDFLEGFREEARLLGELDAPNVVRLVEYRETVAGAAIVMDLVDGVSLRGVLDRDGATEPEPALSVLKGSLLGLGAAHACGVVHRDYKPENVLVTAAGDSVLTDFGIAARAGQAVEVSGTPAYMAPEQWRGEPASPATDIYAATATFVECLTGQPPYPVADVGVLRRNHQHAPIPVDGLPQPVRDLVLAGMAKDPAARPAGTAQFLAELEAAACAGYGEDWDERGRGALARRAALLALLFPLTGGAAGGTAVATTVLGGLVRRRVLVGLGAAAAVAVLLGGAVIVGSQSGDARTVVAGRFANVPAPALPAAPVPQALPIQQGASAPAGAAALAPLRSAASTPGAAGQRRKAPVAAVAAAPEAVVTGADDDSDDDPGAGSGSGPSAPDQGFGSGPDVDADDPAVVPDAGSGGGGSGGGGGTPDDDTPGAVDPDGDPGGGDPGGGGSTPDDGPPDVDPDPNPGGGSGGGGEVPGGGESPNDDCIDGIYCGDPTLPDEGNGEPDDGEGEPGICDGGMIEIDGQLICFPGSGQ